MAAWNRGIEEGMGGRYPRVLHGLVGRGSGRSRGYSGVCAQVWFKLVVPLVKGQGCPVVRKTSDMVLLLGSRGRSRSSGSKFGDTLRGIVGTVFGGNSSRRRDDLRRRNSAVPAWVASALALGCFAGGFLMGDHFGQQKGAKAGVDSLRTSGRKAELLTEADTPRLSAEAFIVSAYPNLDVSAAKEGAKALSDYLRERKIGKARPYWWVDGPKPLWVVAVYFDGPTEREATRNLLQALPADVPDEAFVHLRNTEVEWPKAWPIR